MDVTAGGTVAIQGLGGLGTKPGNPDCAERTRTDVTKIGHLAVQYSRKMGFRTVALSRGTSKKDFATKLGATDYIDTEAHK